MIAEFQFDVFLSHSAKDKPVVRPLGERLREDGLKVWFDEWMLKPDDSIPAKLEEGLEHSRVFVLCMSANAFGSDWAQLPTRSQPPTLDSPPVCAPLNQERRFIPLRLDDAPIKGSLAQFLYISWRPADRERGRAAEQSFHAVAADAETKVELPARCAQIAEDRNDTCPPL